MEHHLVSDSVEQTLEKPFTLESTPGHMEKLIDSGLPWVVEVTRYTGEKDDEGNLLQETVRLSDVDFAKGDEKKISSAMSNVTSLDLKVSRNPNKEDWDDDESIISKHIATGMGVNLVGPSLKKDWFEHEMMEVSESRAHILEWCKEKGIDTQKSEWKYISDKKERKKRKEGLEGWAKLPEKILKARNDEIKKLLDGIAAKSQDYLEKYPASKFTLRVRQMLEAMPEDYPERVKVEESA